MKFLLITANVGSIFEYPSLMKNWFGALNQKILEYKPHVFALHLQEVGGKFHQNTQIHMETFLSYISIENENNHLIECLKEYESSFIFADEDYGFDDTFTALGNIYFFHNSIANSIQIYNFSTHKYESLSNAGNMIFRCNENNRSINVPYVFRKKFPISYFPDEKWSRKGFCLTHWSIGDKQISLLNLHLFHDASNITAFQKSPSIYAECRNKALSWCLHEIKQNLSQNVEKVLLYAFGDFNFRLDLRLFVEKLMETHQDYQYWLALAQTDNSDYIHFKRFAARDEGQSYILNKRTGSISGPNAAQYISQTKMGSNQGNENKLIDSTDVIAHESVLHHHSDHFSKKYLIQIDTKIFNIQPNEEEIFHFTFTKNKWILDTDLEVLAILDKEKLHELPITFCPNYPMDEIEIRPMQYMRTRCPAWCDRILFNSNAKNYMKNAQYGVVGWNICMGDHKPVFSAFEI